MLAHHERSAGNEATAPRDGIVEYRADSMCLSAILLMEGSAVGELRLAIALLIPVTAFSQGIGLRQSNECSQAGRDVVAGQELTSHSWIGVRPRGCAAGVLDRDGGWRSRGSGWQRRWSADFDDGWDASGPSLSGFGPTLYRWGDWASPRRAPSQSRRFSSDPYRMRSDWDPGRPDGVHARGLGDYRLERDLSPWQAYTVRPRPFGGFRIENDLDPLDSYTARPLPFGGYRIEHDYRPGVSYTARPRPGGGYRIENDLNPLDSFTLRPRFRGGYTVEPDR